MSTQNLATSNYTLASFKAVVRTQSNSLSQQESGIIDLQLNDIIHNAVLLVRTMLGRAIDSFYMTQVTLGTISLTSGLGAVTIATYSIADPTRVSIFDPTLKEIPVLSATQFNALRALYTTTQVGATAGFATIEAAAGTPNVLKVEIYTGASGTITTALLYYPRNPEKVTTDANTIDLPDHLIPIAQDMATVSIYRRLSKQAPLDVENRVTSFINSQVSQLGLKITPQGRE